MTLRLGKGFTLPDQAVTQTFGILAKRGAGKSNTAAVMAEEMFEARLPFVVIDPVGAWWGLRSSADGKSAGLPIPIFGGHRGDVPLESSGGELVADLIVEKRLSCVLDVSAFDSEGAKRRFLASFAERLFRLKGQPGHDDPLHLFLEEADDYAPQRAGGVEVNRTLGAFQRIVKQARARGLGSTMVTQRSAVLNKDLLTQIETLIVMRTTSPQDRKAIAGWVEYHGQSAELLASLHELRDGEAWVWSPWLGVTKRVQIRRRSTFDSGATPTIRSKRAPATLADVDLKAITEQMASTIERAKATDPKALQQRVRELEEQLRRASNVSVVVPKTVEVKVPVVPPEVREVGKQIGTLAQNLSQVVTLAHDLADRIEKSAAQAEVAVTARPAAAVTPTHAPAHTAAPPPRPAAADVDADGLRPGAKRMLAVVTRQHPMPVTRSQLATLSGVKRRGGSYGTYLSALRSRGLIEVDGEQVKATDAGLDAAGVAAPAPMTQDELVTMYRQRLRPGAQRMLDVLLGAYPEWLTRDELSERSGISRSGGSFGTYLGALRSNGLAEVKGEQVRAGEALFAVA
jgi:hypothetical protein